MRIVLDTNILVRANPRVVRQALARDLLLTIVADGDHTLILSPAILAEARRVLQYPNVQKRWPLSEEEISRYLSALTAAAHVVELPGTAPAIVSDPDDDPILQTAVAGLAQVLCTRDEAFNDIAVHAFSGNHGIRVMNDIDLIHELRRLSEARGGASES